MGTAAGCPGLWTQAGLPPNPVLGYSGEEIGDDGTAGKQGGFIGQQVVTAGKLRLSRNAACQEVIRLEQELAARRLQVLTDVRTSFFDVLVSQRQISVTDQLVGLAQQGVQVAEALLKAQEASRVDLLQARVEAHGAWILLENAHSRHLAAWRRLAAVVGMPDMPIAQLAGDIEAIAEPLVWEEVLADLLTRSPELAAAGAEVQAARWSLERARVQCVPDLDLETSVHHDNATGDDVVGVHVGLPLPLLDHNQGNIAAAQGAAAGGRAKRATVASGTA